MSSAGATTGRVFFGVAVAASGLQQLAIGQFVRLVPKLPDWVPGQPLLARLGGVLLVALGVLILTGRLARLAAAVLALLLLAILLLLYAPQIAANPWAGFVYTNPLKVLAFVGGLALMVSRLPDGAPSGGASLLERTSGLAPYLFAAFLVVCGIQHFWYLPFVTELVPSYLPARRFWAQFAGVALVAGGIGSIVPRTARLAGLMAGLMIFLWVPMLHIPRALADLSVPGETSAIFEALAMSGVALLVAATRSPLSDE
jgi:uncharacterized membrane protein YphA (DoxX/SURF4 family)